MHIIVFEDSDKDLKRRYAPLAKEHHITAYLNTERRDRTNISEVDFANVFWGLPAQLLDEIRKASPQRFVSSDEVSSDFAPLFAGTEEYTFKALINEDDLMPRADAYCFDGLEGLCFPMANRLDAQQVYINSGSGWIRNKAEQLGYKIGLEYSTQRIILE